MTVMTTEKPITWWVVILPGEDATSSTMYGPFRAEDTAQAVVDKWQSDHVCDDMYCWKYHPEVKPLQPAREIDDAR